MNDALGNSADDRNAGSRGHEDLSADRDGPDIHQIPQVEDDETEAPLHLLAGDGLTALRDHWAMHPHWTPARREHAVHLTVESADEVHEIARAVHVALAHLPELVPVPEPWLHLTLSGIGAEEDLGAARAAAALSRIREAVAELPVGPFTFDTLLVAHESVMLTGPTPAWLADHVAAHRAAIDETLGPRDWRPLWPHVSLAYCQGEPPADQVLEALATVVEGREAITVLRPTPSRVRLRRDESGYRWDDCEPLH